MYLFFKSCALVLLLLAGFVLWSNLRAARNEARAEADFPPNGQLIEIDGHVVHAVVMGEGPDVVLLHGSSGNTRDMTLSMAPELVDRYRVIILDRPGLGYSDRIDPNGARLADQAGILARAAEMLGAKTPIVVGHSYGGAVALAWAVHHPGNIAALVPVSAPSNPWETPLPTLYRVTSHPVGSALVVPTLSALVGETYVNQLVQEIFRPEQVPQNYASRVGARLSLRREALRENARQRANILSDIQALQPRYGDIAVPTEILHGDADDTVPIHIHSEKLVLQIPDAVLTRLPGVGHMPQHTATRDIGAAIDRAAMRAGLR